MSDFVNNFWSIYIAVITIVGIFGCLLLLILTARKKVDSAADNTTGHVWDGDLRELNNPMPRWWSWLFVITVIFALVYLALYPGLGNFKGMLGWTSVGQHTAEVAKVDAAVKPLYDKYLAMDLKAVSADKQAMEMGKRLYLTYCMQCHTPLIVRDWYDIRYYSVDPFGQCPNCHTPLSGRYAGQLGGDGKAFGPKRIPVRFSR